MTERDEAESNENKIDPSSDKRVIQNSATIRTLLSLRNIVYSKGLSHGSISENWTHDLRVVVQLQAACKFIDAATFMSPEGGPCVYPQDLTVYLNTLMFHCASQPGLSRVLITIMDFDGVSFNLIFQSFMMSLFSFQLQFQGCELFRKRIIFVFRLFLFSAFYKLQKWELRRFNHSSVRSSVHQ